MIARSNGVHLFHTVHGSGPPMLVMHGGMGWDHSYLRPWLDPLGDVAELIFYDHRGCGRSERNVDWSGVDHDTWVEDAEALREHLGHERILVFGHSYGGYLAQEYALSHPDRVDGLLLCSTAPAMDYADVIGANAAARATPDQLAAVGELFAAQVADDEAFASLMSRVLPLYFHRHNESYGETLFPKRSVSAAAFNHAFRNCVPAFNTLDRLEEISVPTLLINGSDDWLTPADRTLDRLRAGIPHANVRVIDEAGHFPFIERPAEFATVVESWLEVHESA